MSLLARKINRGRWIRKPYLPETAIRADSVTDLKTTNDELSLWRCEGNDDVDQVFLALATGSHVTSFDTMDVVLLPEAELTNAGVLIVSVAGDTAVEELKSRHVNLVRLDLERLGALAETLTEFVKRNEVQRRTKGQISRLLQSALSAGRLQAEELSEELRAKLP
jgi:hypothetical protein